MRRRAATRSVTSPTADASPHDCDNHPERCCLDPDCPPGHCVALGVIDVADRDVFGTACRIDRSGRRSVAQAREHLTHICGINWTHGGFMKVSALKHAEDSLRSRAAAVRHRQAAGAARDQRAHVRRAYGEQHDERQMEDLDFVEYARAPYLSADGRTAIYEIRKPATYRRHIIHVTVRCDFILDCRRQPVDGDHLAGSCRPATASPAARSKAGSTSSTTTTTTG